MARANYRKRSSNRSDVRAASLKSSRRPLKPSPIFGRIYEKLDDHQRDAVEFALETKCTALFMEQRTGKTYVTGGVIEKLWRNERGRLKTNFAGLIVCPLTAVETVWVPFLRDVLRISSDQIFTDYGSFAFLGGYRGVLLLHYEALSANIKSLLSSHVNWTLIVVDESQRLINRNSKQSRLVARLRNSAEYKLILTGTPIEQKPQDLWAQFRFLVPDLFGTRWKDFEEEYLEPLKIDPKKYRPGSYRWKKAIRLSMMLKNKRKMRADKLPQFTRLIKPYVFRLMQADVPGFLSLNEIPVDIVLRGKQRRIYDELERELVVYLGKNDKIIAPLTVTKIGKLQQICGGYVLTEDSIWEVGRAKLRATLAIVRRQSKPFVVFCRYLEEIVSLARELERRGYRIDMMVGKNRKRRPEVQRQFQRGELDGLLCQIRTGGVALDLSRASTGIMYSTTHSSIDFDQAKKRLQKRGKTKRVNLFLLRGENTVDQDIYRAYVEKCSVVESVLRRLKQQRKSHGEGSRA